jgi:hypothetical protein
VLRAVQVLNDCLWPKVVLLRPISVFDLRSEAVIALLRPPNPIRIGLVFAHSVDIVPSRSQSGSYASQHPAATKYISGEA